MKTAAELGAWLQQRAQELVKAGMVYEEAGMQEQLLQIMAKSEAASSSRSMQKSRQGCGNCGH